MAYDLIPYYGCLFISYVRVLLDLVGDYTFGDYTSAVYLYLRSILTAGVHGSWFYVIVHLFISPWIINSERFHFNVLYILVF